MAVSGFVLLSETWVVAPRWEEFVLNSRAESLQRGVRAVSGRNDSESESEKKCVFSWPELYALMDVVPPTTARHEGSSPCYQREAVLIGKSWQFCDDIVWRHLVLVGFQVNAEATVHPDLLLEWVKHLHTSLLTLMSRLKTGWAVLPLDHTELWPHYAPRVNLFMSEMKRCHFLI